MGQPRKVIAKKASQAVINHGESSHLSQNRLGSGMNINQSLGQSSMSLGGAFQKGNKKGKSAVKYVSEFKEERGPSGFIVREMAPKYTGGPLNPNIESVDEGFSHTSSSRSSRSKNRKSRNKLGFTPSSSSLSAESRGYTTNSKQQKLNMNPLDQSFLPMRDF